MIWKGRAVLVIALLLGAVIFGYTVTSWKSLDGGDQAAADSSEENLDSGSRNLVSADLNTADAPRPATGTLLPIFHPVSPGANSEQDSGFFDWLKGMVSSVSFEMVQQTLLSDQPEHRKAAVLETYIEAFGGKGVRKDIAKWQQLLNHLLARPELISSDLTAELSMVLGVIAKDNPEMREVYTREFLRTVNDPNAEDRTVILASGVWEPEILENAALDGALGYRVRAASVRAITHCGGAIESFVALLKSPSIDLMLQEDIARFAPRAAKKPKEIETLMETANQIPDASSRKRVVEILVGNVSSAGFPGTGMFYLNLFQKDFLEKARDAGECPESYFSPPGAYHAYYLEEDAAAKTQYQTAVLNVFEAWFPKWRDSEMPKCFWDTLEFYAETFEVDCRSYHQYDKEPNAVDKYCMEPKFERRVKALREKYVKDDL